MKKLLAVIIMAACTGYAVTNTEVLNTMDTYAHTIKVDGITIGNTTTTVRIKHNVFGQTDVKLVLSGQWVIEQGSVIRTSYEDGVLYAYFNNNKAIVNKMEVE